MLISFAVTVKLNCKADLRLCFHTGKNPVLSRCGSIIVDQCSVITVQGPVVQSIVSLTISLIHKFVKQISAKLTNTLLFFVENKK